MNPSSSSLSFRSSHTRPSIHRGDVSSSAHSSPAANDKGEDPLRTPTRETLSGHFTPKRKVIEAMETSSVGKVNSGRKRDRVTARLEQVARVKKSKSTGDGLNASPSLTRSMMEQAVNIGPKLDDDDPIYSGASQAKDKVVVCVRSVQI